MSHRKLINLVNMSVKASPLLSSTGHTQPESRGAEIRDDARQWAQREGQRTCRMGRLWVKMNKNSLIHEALAILIFKHFFCLCSSDNSSFKKLFIVNILRELSQNFTEDR